MPTPVITRDEYLEFDTVDSIPAIPLNTPAWECESYVQFADAPPAVGDNRAIPGVRGRLFVPHELDQAQVSLRITVLGAFDYEGTAYDDPRIGVRSNLRFLRDNLLVPQEAARAVTFYRLDGDTETGDVVVVPPFQPVMVGTSGARVVLSILVLDGLLTLTGS